MSSRPEGVQGEEIKLRARDGYEYISAFRFDPVGEAKAAFIMSNATGVLQKFYHGFASWLATHGVGVLTYDYRFTGRSFPPEQMAKLSAAAGDEDGFEEAYYEALLTCPKDVECTSTWARQDLAAAVRHAAARWPGVDLTLGGNSLGGHLCGLLGIDTVLGIDGNEEQAATKTSQPPVQQVTRILNVCGGNAHWRYNPQGKAAWFALKTLIGDPLEEDGVFRSTSVGLGYDLPYGPGKEWISWVQTRMFALARREDARNVREITSVVPYLYIGFEDDESIGKLMMEEQVSLLCHPQSNVHTLWIDPLAHQPRWPRCGHVNSFTPSSAIPGDSGDDQSTTPPDADSVPRGAEMYAMTPEEKGEEQRQTELRREDTIFKTYLRWIVDGDVDDQAGEKRFWGPEDRKNHESVWRIEEEERAKGEPIIGEDDLADDDMDEEEEVRKARL